MKILLLVFTIIYPLISFAQIDTISVWGKMAKIENPVLVDFLKTHIVPMAKIADYRYNLINISKPNTKDNDLYEIVVFGCNSSIERIDLYAKKDDYYISFIDGIMFVLEDNKLNNTWFKPTNKELLLGFYTKERGDLPRISIVDCEETFVIENINNKCVIVDYQSWGYPWRNDKRMNEFFPSIPNNIDQSKR